MTEKEYLIALYAFVPFGSERIKLLSSYFGSYKDVWSAESSMLSKVGLSPKLVNAFCHYRDLFSAQEYFSKLKRFCIGCVTVLDKKYPFNLKGLTSAPLVLYFKGKIEACRKDAVAIVGSRKMTFYGRRVTETFSHQLADMGVVIVSGLARGVDTCAHKAAFRRKGKTVAVLGSGLDIIYPPENAGLAKQIIKKGGAVVSEYPLGYPVKRENFVNRNRIISGLSKVVVVIEGEQKSGTLLTASHAAEQGKCVFAVPGQITSPLSAAPHFLIQNGARIAFRVEDIVDELKIKAS